MSELQTFFDQVRSELRAGQLRISDEFFFSNMLANEGTFIDHEGELWDFKSTWPHSYSDSYFFGLAKHVSGFANNMGGLLIFHVVDETRKYHESKIKTNFDKFHLAISQIVLPTPKFEYRLFLRGEMTVPVVVVYPNRADELPSVLRLGAKTKILRWPVRSGPKTVDAAAKDIPTLFCRPQVRGTDKGHGLVSAALPPSPATMKHFVRRNEIMTRVFGWLHDPAQPRTFLYGRGGSGKTTIAYEVARHVAEYGLRLFGDADGDVEIVIFVSAKQIELDVLSGESREFGTIDFSDTRGLLEAIVILSGWNPEVDTSRLDRSELLKVVSTIFDAFSMLLVVDDIDTLTTKGEDAGLEALFLILARSKRPAKVLYTMRNVPTYALANSIEVPGLSSEEELSEFFSLCAEKFKVPIPTETEAKSIVNAAEARPLAIESICALRRSFATYERAVEGFVQHAGDGARQYVFQREWDVLAVNNRARGVLAALSLLRSPISVDALKVILNYDDDLLQEAIAEAREMFIDVDETPTGSLYSVGALTRGFIESQAKTLDRFDQIKARVDNYRKTYHPKLPQLAVLRPRVERLMALAYRENDEAYSDRAWQMLHDQHLPVALREAPAFKELLGEVAVRTAPPKLTEAREAFYYASSMKYVLSPDILRLWFNAEARSGAGGEHCPRITDIVKTGRNYKTSDRVEFQLLENSRKYQLGKEVRFDSPDQSMQLLCDAAADYLVTFKAGVMCNHIRLARIEEYGRNTAYLALLQINRYADVPRFAALLDSVSKESDSYYDLLFDPLNEYLAPISKQAVTKEAVGRLLNSLSRFSKSIGQEDRWYSGGLGTAMNIAVAPVLNELALRLK